MITPAVSILRLADHDCRPHLLLSLSDRDRSEVARALSVLEQA
ncbi:hypothetical protein ACQE32_06625 [Pantoea sp. FN0302]